MAISKSKQALPAASTATGEKQTVQARHGTATFVPMGHTIKIINTYGRQVVDTWAFALHAPPTEEEFDEDRRGEEEVAKGMSEGSGVWVNSGDAERESQRGDVDERGKSIDGRMKEYNVEESKDGEEKVEEGKEKVASDTEKNVKMESEQSQGPPKGWSSYIPSVRGRGMANSGEKQKGGETGNSKGWGAYIPSIRGAKGQGDSKDSPAKTWSSYIPSGKGYSSYLPSKETLSAFASSHQRDPTKSVAEQLYDFSKTPVGAAGLSVASGSGYSSSLYAAYSAYSSSASARSYGARPGMEFLSMSHTRASTQHLSPRVGDVLRSNLRAPLLTLLEDTSPGAHDTLIAACDPQRYKELGVEKWEEHGSCAENLVLALQELNMRTGLKGRNAIGGDVTVNQVPAPLNLFMNIPWTEEGEVSFEPPKGKRGDYVKFRAERDVVVVMSACPQDILEINGKKPMVAHFVVESPSAEDRKFAEQRDAEAQQIIEKAKSRTTAKPKEKAKPAARPKPKTIDNNKPVQKRTTQNATPTKETQKVNSSAARPQQERQPSSNAPKPGRNKPKKLERRSSAAVARASA